MAVPSQPGSLKNIGEASLFSSAIRHSSWEACPSPIDYNLGGHASILATVTFIPHASDQGHVPSQRKSHPDHIPFPVMVIPRVAGGASKLRRLNIIWQLEE